MTGEELVPTGRSKAAAKTKRELAGRTGGVFGLRA